MVSEFGHAFLKTLYTTGHPMTFREITSTSGFSERYIWRVSARTYVKCYLVDKGLVIHQMMEHSNKSWYIITKKGELLVDRKKILNQLRTQVDHTVRSMMSSYAWAMNRLRKKIELEIWNWTDDPVEYYELEMRKLHIRYSKLLSLMEMIPNAESKVHTAAISAFARSYIRYINDPDDRPYARYALEILKDLVPHEVLKEKLPKRLRLGLRNELMVRSYEEIRPDSPLYKIAANYGIDVTAALQEVTRRQETRMLRHQQDIKDGKRCFKCGNSIHVKQAIKQAEDLKLNTGIQSATVCCYCFGKLEEEEALRKTDNAYVSKIQAE